MQAAELVRVSLFLGFVVFVAWKAARALVAKARRRPLDRGARVWLVLAGLGALCVLYGFFVEPYWLETTHVPLSVKNLAKPLRIAHISDTHSDAKPRLEESLPAAVAAEKPDVIVFTGDAANSREGFPVVRKLLSELARIAPTFVVRGNWDTGGGGLAWSEAEEIEARRDLFGGTGVRELDGDAAPLRSDVWLSGVADSHHDKIDATLALVPKGALSIFLCHRPDMIEPAVRGGADLYLAGHTHGGQVALPFYGALVTFSKYGKTYEHGVYHVKDTWLYVNRGLGMDGNGAPRVRFCARPELTILELSPVASR